MQAISDQKRCADAVRQDRKARSRDPSRSVWLAIEDAWLHVGRSQQRWTGIVRATSGLTRTGLERRTTLAWVYPTVQVRDDALVAFVGRA